MSHYMNYPSQYGPMEAHYYYIISLEDLCYQFQVCTLKVYDRFINQLDSKANKK
jgi:hypothetical protein